MPPKLISLHYEPTASVDATLSPEVPFLFPLCLLWLLSTYVRIVPFQDFGCFRDLRHSSFLFFVAVADSADREGGDRRRNISTIR